MGNNKLVNMINELEEYSNLENTEVGEVCSLLVEISRYSDFISREFYSSLQKEIKSQLDNFKNNTKIVQEIITHKSVSKKLEWI